MPDCRGHSEALGLYLNGTGKALMSVKLGERHDLSILHSRSITLAADGLNGARL